MLNCIDNSGASIVECVANLRMKRHAKIGMVFTKSTLEELESYLSAQGIASLSSSRSNDHSVKAPGLEEEVRHRLREGTRCGEETSAMLSWFGRRRSYSEKTVVSCGLMTMRVY